MLVKEKGTISEGEKDSDDVDVFEEEDEEIIVDEDSYEKYESLTDEIRRRGNEIMKYYEDVHNELNDIDGWVDNLHKKYDYFRKNSHKILTGDGKTSLRGQKTKVCDARIITNYNSFSDNYDESTYGIFVNKDMIGKHYKPVNTQKKLKPLNRMEFMSFMGRYGKELTDTLSGYFKKSNKARRICRLVEKYGYGDEPPIYGTTSVYETKDKYLTTNIYNLSVTPEDEDGYPGMCKRKVKKIKFTTTDMAYKSWRKKTSSNKVEIVYESIGDNRGNTYEQHLDGRLGANSLLHHIDCIDDIKKCIDIGVEKRKRKQRKFNSFLNEFKEEFKKELIAIKL